MGKWWVNAKGAKSVSYDSKAKAEKVAKQVQGGFVSEGSPKEQGIMPALVRLIRGGDNKFNPPRGHR